MQLSTYLTSIQLIRHGLPWAIVLLLLLTACSPVRPVAPMEEVGQEAADDTTVAAPGAADAADSTVLAQGAFTDIDRAHRGSGTARIVQERSDRTLQLENFQTTKGPDLRVLLVENPEGRRSAELGEYVDLGSLTSVSGDQAYAIPADLDLSQFNGVMIYCKPFHVVFTVAAFAN